MVGARNLPHIYTQPIRGEGVSICREGLFLDGAPYFSILRVFAVSPSVSCTCITLDTILISRIHYSCHHMAAHVVVFFCPESMPCMCAVISVHMHVYQSFFVGFSLLRVVIRDEDFFSPDLISSFHAELPIGCNVSHQFGDILHSLAFALHRQVCVIFGHLAVCMSQYRTNLVYGRSAGRY